MSRLSTAGLILLLAVASAADKSTLWVFWFQQNNRVYNEMYTGKEECQKAEANWEKDSAMPPIAFRCAAVTERLYRQAKVRCRQKEPLACLWRDDIEKLLEIQRAR